MDDIIRVFSGRTFSPEDIELIKWARRTYSKLSRRELAATVCELLDWNTPSGNAKCPQCLEYLELLELKGILGLPKIRSIKKSCREKPVIKIESIEVKGEVTDYSPVELMIVRPGEDLKRWRSYIDQYHILKDKTVFGSRLHYFIKSGEIELGCMQFSASSWALEDRDKLIGWTVDDRKARLHLIVNNSRFLIFPWIHIRNLASKALSIAVKQIQGDWLREYCFAPVLLETFVDLSNFRGTCYKAADWIYIGETKGRGRMDRNKEIALSKKAIYMYPLQKDFKEVLRGEKAYRVVNRDE